MLERLRQKKMLDAFVDRWFHGPDGTLVAAFHPFQDTAQFEDLLEIHLGKLVEPPARGCWAGSRGSAGGRAHAPFWTAGSPFRGLEVFEREHARIYFGRTRAVGDVLAALRKQAADGRAFLLVLGASGCGKSSLVRAGVLPLLTQPGRHRGRGPVATCHPPPRRSLGRPVRPAGRGPRRASQPCPSSSPTARPTVELARLLRENPGSAYALAKGAFSQAASRLEPIPGTDRQPESRFLPHRRSARGAVYRRADHARGAVRLH